jgi:hypothetical protein
MEASKLDPPSPMMAGTGPLALPFGFLRHPRAVGHLEQIRKRAVAAVFRIWDRAIVAVELLELGIVDITRRGATATWLRGRATGVLATTAGLRARAAAARLPPVASSPEPELPPSSVVPPVSDTPPLPEDPPLLLLPPSSDVPPEEEDPPEPELPPVACPEVG